MKINKLIIIALLFCSAKYSFSQNYQTALGVRLGFYNGLTAKHFVAPNNALEGIATFRWGGFALTGLYEWQKPIPNFYGIEYFVGGGAHIATVNGKYYNHYKDKVEGDNHFIFGVDFILGMEYSFPEAPINISLDWKPAVNLIGAYNWWPDGVALSVRYLLR